MQVAAFRFSQVTPANTAIKMPVAIRNRTASSDDADADGAMNKRPPTPSGGAIPERHPAKHSGLRTKRRAPETSIAGRMVLQEPLAQRMPPDHAHDDPGPDKDQQASVIPDRSSRPLRQQGSERDEDEQRRNTLDDGPLLGTPDELVNDGFVIHIHYSYIIRRPRARFAGLICDGT